MGYAECYDPDVDVDRWYTDATSRSLINWIRPGDHVLELGCATGRMTSAIVAAGADVVAVDREEAYLARARARDLAAARFEIAEIEAYVSGRTPGGRFDHVVLSNVLHEVADPVKVLALVRRWLSPWGLVHVTLQNPSSIHRLIGFSSGAIADLHEISDRGNQFETLRLVDLNGMRRWGREAGLRDIHHEGVMIKPLPNTQLAELNDDVMNGFAGAGRLLADHASMNYLIFRSAGDS